MKRESRRPAGDSLSTVQGKFERWRKSRPLGTRIPEALWRAAVEVGREHGPSKTAQTLRLDHYALKKRLEAAPGERSAAEQPSERGFLEIPLWASCAPPECVLEIEEGRVRVDRGPLDGRSRAIGIRGQMALKAAPGRPAGTSEVAGDGAGGVD